MHNNKLGEGLFGGSDFVNCGAGVSKKLPSNVCFIVLASHTLLSPQSCHAYPAPLSQRNITVSYKKEKRKEGGQLRNFLQS